MKNFADKKLRIAVFCQTEFAIPPPRTMKDIYAPLWLVHYIAEELVARGHDVTLFAPSDSKTKGRLISDNLISLANSKEFAPYYKQVTELDQEKFFWQLAGRNAAIDQYDYLFLSRLYQMASKGKFDVIYISMIGMRPLPFAATVDIPTVCTIHAAPDPLTVQFFTKYKKRYPQLHFVGISKKQTEVAPEIFTDVVYNGIDLDAFSFNPKPDNHLLFSGRISREKGAVEAIEVAKKAGIPLQIYGRHTEDPYWHKEISPQLNSSIEYKGLLPYWEIPPIYQRAKATLVPINWEEPFGLVMVESMACGTPVIAFRRGSVPEIIEDGVNGFIVNNVDEMAEAVKNIDKIDRREVRKNVERRFSKKAMVDGYEKIFYKVAEST